MRSPVLTLGLLLSLTPLVLAQQNTNPTPPPSSGDQTTTAPAQNQTNVPSGTEVQREEREAVVTPEQKPVKLTPELISAAQKELRDRGYDPGPPDGRMGPQTRKAIEQFQMNSNIPKTGTLDATTLSKLHVGGAQIVGSAPAELGRGGKAVGHDVKEGHPIDAAKAGAKGSASFGKKVGKGTKSLTLEGTEKVGKGLSSVGSKITGKTEGKDKEKEPQKQPPEENEPK